jgi:hypothetical protein
MDNPELHDYNLDRRARDFVEYAKNANKAYRTNHVAITTGMDFHYQVNFKYSEKTTKNLRNLPIAFFFYLNQLEILSYFCGLLRKYEPYDSVISFLVGGFLKYSYRKEANESSQNLLSPLWIFQQIMYI